MGREFELRANGEELLMRPMTASETWHFVAEPADPAHPFDRWRCQNGEEAGEILTVLRSDEGEAVGLDLATFVYRRAPMAD